MTPDDKPPRAQATEADRTLYFKLYRGDYVPNAMSQEEVKRDLELIAQHRLSAISLATQEKEEELKRLREDMESCVHNAKLYHWVMERCTEAVDLVENHEAYPYKTAEKEIADLTARIAELEKALTRIAKETYSMIDAGAIAEKALSARVAMNPASHDTH